MDNNKNLDRINYITFASVISALAVVYLHANGCFWVFGGSQRWWFTANIIESVFYFAVPVFFMITGATLIDYSDKYSTLIYFKKRFKKTVIPYLFWSFISVPFLIFFTKTIDISQINISYLVNGIMKGNIIAIYWFFIPLFIIYLSIPLFSFVKQDVKLNIFIYIIVLTFIFNNLLPFIFMVIGKQLPYNRFIDVGSNFMMWVLLGYVLSKKDIKKKYRFIFYTFSLIGLLIHAVCTYNLSIEAEEIITKYKGYNNLPCILYSIGIFILFKYAGSNLMKNKIIYRIINILSKYTFAVYLTHWHALKIITIAFSINKFSIYYRLFIPILAYLLISIFVYLIRKLPFGKEILP